MLPEVSRKINPTACGVYIVSGPDPIRQENIPHPILIGTSSRETRRQRPVSSPPQQCRPSSSLSPSPTLLVSAGRPPGQFRPFGVSDSPSHRLAFPHRLRPPPGDFLSKDLIIAALTAYTIRGIAVLSARLPPSIKRFLTKECDYKEVVSPTPLIHNFIKPQVAASIPGFFFCMWYAAMKYCLANNILGISSRIQLLFADAVSPSSILSIGDSVMLGTFVALALRIAVTRVSKNRFFNCAFLLYIVGSTVIIIIMNWFQAAQDGEPAILQVAPGVIGFVTVYCFWNGEVKLDGMNQLMGKVWDWIIYGTKLKKFDGSVLAANEDGGRCEDYATAFREDRGDDPKDGSSDPESSEDSDGSVLAANEDGGRCEDYATALREDRGDDPKDGSSDSESSEDSDGSVLRLFFQEENDCATNKRNGFRASVSSALSAANEDGGRCEDDATALWEDRGDDPKDGSSDPESSEDSDDWQDGHRVVQFLAISANFPICKINGYDHEHGRCIYAHSEGEVQEDGMVDLVPIGPCEILMAYSQIGLEIFYYTTAGDEGDVVSVDEGGLRPLGPPIRVQWSVDDNEIEEYTQTICAGRGRKLDITYLVIPAAVQTNVEVRLKLKDFGSTSHAVYGKIKATAIDYGNKSVHLFSCDRGRCLSIRSGTTSILPLWPSKIALPCSRLLKFHIEVDLTVITTCDSHEEDKNLKFSLEFTRGITSQERQVDGDQVEVKIEHYSNY